MEAKAKVSIFKLISLRTCSQGKWEGGKHETEKKEIKLWLSCRLVESLGFELHHKKGKGRRSCFLIPISSSHYLCICLCVQRGWGGMH